MALTTPQGVSPVILRHMLTDQGSNSALFKVVSTRRGLRLSRTSSIPRSFPHTNDPNSGPDQIGENRCTRACHHGLRHESTEHSGMHEEINDTGNHTQHERDYPSLISARNEDTDGCSDPGDDPGLRRDQYMAQADRQHVPLYHRYQTGRRGLCDIFNNGSDCLAHLFFYNSEL